MVMNIIRHIRNNRCLSQRAFARKASLSFRGLQLMEEQSHNWRISSIHKIAEALDLPKNGIDQLLEQFLAQNRDSIMIASFRILADGPASWPLHLFNFVDSFRRFPDESLIHMPPADNLQNPLKCLLTATVETLCAESNMEQPGWCRGILCLKDPWFVAGVENLKAMSLVESPVRFRKRNIFVLENFLDRA